MGSSERSVIKVLNRDHRRIADLLLMLCAARDASERRRLANEVSSELTSHAAAEDRFLYPAIHTMVPARAFDVTLEANAHDRIINILAALEAVEATSCRFDALVTKLICEVHRETLHEEADIFPRLARYADERTLIELGDQIQAFKDTRH
jgi:hemerythrin superfamily protein